MKSLKRYFIVCCILLCSHSITVSATEKQDISVYVSSLMNQFFAIANDKNIQKEEKISKAKTILAENMDFSWMSKFVLGRYRRDISAQELSDFNEAYKNYFISTYSTTITSYHGEKINVKTVQSLSADEYVVKIEIKGDSQPFVIDYLVRQYTTSENKVTYKVFDIVTEGVSLISSQQSEFGAIISSNNVQYLRNILIDKAKQAGNGAS